MTMTNQVLPIEELIQTLYAISSNAIKERETLLAKFNSDSGNFGKPFSETENQIYENTYDAERIRQISALFGEIRQVTVNQTLHAIWDDFLNNSHFYLHNYRTMNKSKAHFRLGSAVTIWSVYVGGNSGYPISVTLTDNLNSNSRNATSHCFPYDKVLIAALY